MVVGNPFQYADPGRYYRARPRYQNELLAQVAEILELRERVAVALDVGCGTGHSAAAALEWAGRVVAIDTVQSMLESADRPTGIHYVRGAAEELPLAGKTVDLVTAGAVFHWLDAQAFLAEALRVIGPGGALVVYTDFFTGRVVEAPRVEAWIKETYLVRNPSPPRGRPLNSELAAAYGFELIGTAELELPFRMTLEEFVDYLLTQSNALASVQCGRVTAEGLHREIHSEVRPLYPPLRGTVVFGARAHCFRAAIG